MSKIKSTDLIDTCIMPIFLYGCEVWVLTKDLLQQLESFQAELGKRILCLPPYYIQSSVGSSAAQVAFDACTIGLSQTFLSSI